MMMMTSRMVVVYVKKVTKEEAGDDGASNLIGMVHDFQLKPRPRHCPY